MTGASILLLLTAAAAAQQAPAPAPPPAAPAAPAATPSEGPPASDGMLTVRVAVPARSSLWSVASNPSLPIGAVDAAPAVRITGFAADRDGKLTIVPEGTTTAEGQQVPATGVAGKAANGLKTSEGLFPSFYAPRLLYPINRHALMAIFVDAQDHVIGRPFPVGTGVRVVVPSNAAALNLGFNDTSFTGNSGSLQVIVRMPEP